MEPMHHQSNNLMCRYLPDMPRQSQEEKLPLYPCSQLTAVLKKGGQPDAPVIPCIGQKPVGKELPHGGWCAVTAIALFSMVVAMVRFLPGMEGLGTVAGKRTGAGIIYAWVPERNR